MKILRLEIQNLLAITAFELAPDGKSVVIGGANGAGKSSVINAIQAAFGGGRAIPDEPVHHGAESAVVVCETEDLIVTRKWDADGETKLEVRSRDGSRVGRPQEVLDKLFDSLTFDPIAFERMSPKEQRATLMRIAGLDFTQQDRERASMFDDRTDVNRDIKRLEGALASCAPARPGGATVERSVGELLEELATRERVNKSNEAQRLELTSQRERAVEIKAEIERRENELADARTTLAGITDNGKAMAASVEALTDLEVSTVSAQIENLEADNKAARDYAARKKISDELTAAQAQADAITGTIKAIDKSKADKAAETEYPVDGLEVTEDGVRLNGVPFANASAAERLRASVAIMAASNPGLRVMLIRDGGLFDEASMKILAEIADKHDIQTWTEVVGNRDECTVIMEGGAVAG